MSAEVEQDDPSFEASDAPSFEALEGKESEIEQQVKAKAKEREFAEKGPEAFDWDQVRQLRESNTCRLASSPSLTTLVSSEERDPELESGAIEDEG